LLEVREIEGAELMIGVLGSISVAGSLVVGSAAKVGAAGGPLAIRSVEDNAATRVAALSSEADLGLAEGEADVKIGMI
jgi:hypothetical protein